MKSVKKLSSVALASAAGALLLAGCASTANMDTAKVKSGAAMQKVSMAKVQCSGINSCKGASSCQTATSGCKGLNSCKGKGWIPETKANCLSKGGKVGKTIKM